MGISDDIVGQIERALNAGISKDNLRETAKELAKSIKTRTRLGKGVIKDGATLKSLKKLDPNYKKRRKGLQKSGNLSAKTKPAKSNLTKSGKMLDSIRSRLTLNGFEIFLHGDDNKMKAKEVQRTRPYMFLSKFELKMIVKNIVERVRRATK